MATYRWNMAAVSPANAAREVAMKSSRLTVGLTRAHSPPAAPVLLYWCGVAGETHKGRLRLTKVNGGEARA